MREVPHLHTAYNYGRYFGHITQSGYTIYASVAWYTMKHIFFDMQWIFVLQHHVHQSGGALPPILEREGGTGKKLPPAPTPLYFNNANKVHVSSRLSLIWMRL